MWRCNAVYKHPWGRCNPSEVIPTWKVAPGPLWGGGEEDVPPAGRIPEQWRRCSCSPTLPTRRVTFHSNAAVVLDLSNSMFAQFRQRSFCVRVHMGRVLHFARERSSGQCCIYANDSKCKKIGILKMDMPFLSFFRNQTFFCKKALQYALSNYGHRSAVNF